MQFEQVVEAINDSEMVLVGIGEEFEEGISVLEKSDIYHIFRTKIENENLDENEYVWMYPYMLKEALKENENEDKILIAYRNLARVLENKNYFIVSMNMDGTILDAGLTRDKIVEPFGNYRFYQCNNGCDDRLWEDIQSVSSIIKGIMETGVSLTEIKQPVCESCGEKIVFNNVNAKKYLESGYLDYWKNYTMWLQGTLNRKLCILELGVSLNYPSIIRWPFEKTAFYNQKSKLIRINSRFPQLTEEIKERGISVKESPVEFFANGIV